MIAPGLCSETMRLIEYDYVHFMDNDRYFFSQHPSYPHDKLWSWIPDEFRDPLRALEFFQLEELEANDDLEAFVYLRPGASTSGAWLGPKEKPRHVQTSGLVLQPSLDLYLSAQAALLGAGFRDEDSGWGGVGNATVSFVEPESIKPWLPGAPPERPAGHVRDLPLSSSAIPAWKFIFAETDQGLFTYTFFIKRAPHARLLNDDWRGATWHATGAFSERWNEEPHSLRLYAGREKWCKTADERQALAEPPVSIALCIWCVAADNARLAAEQMRGVAERSSEYADLSAAAREVFHECLASMEEKRSCAEENARQQLAAMGEG